MVLMCEQEEQMKMEGWLYLVRSNRFRLQYSRKRFFVLQGNTLNCYKSIPNSNHHQDLARSAVIDSCIRVTDNGRESIHRNVFYIFTLYNASNHNDQLKLGARSSEEAARWIHCLMEAALKEIPIKGENAVACSDIRWQPFRLSRTKGRSRIYSRDWTAFSSVHMDSMSSDVIAPSSWTIFGCENGLRLFKEAKDSDFYDKYWDDHPAIMAVGVVDATSEAIFQTVMSLGKSRSEWDFCFSDGTVVEHIDGHTEIIHKKLCGDWLPWGMKRRDLLLRRYWRREDDGTYVILYHSVFHQKCQPERGYIRACLKSGGYVISPHGKQSVVKHMLSIDWKFWSSYLCASSAKYITIRMLGRLGALREFFQAKTGNYQGSDFSSGEVSRDLRLSQAPKEVELKLEGEFMDSTRELQRSPKEKGGGSFRAMNDAADEFFDFPDDAEYDQLEELWPSDDGAHSQDQRQPKLSTAAVFVKKLHDLAVQRRGYVDLQDTSNGDTVHFKYRGTLRKDPSCTTACSWTTADPSTFLIRSDTYLQDRHKIKANGTLMQLVAVDWLKSEKRQDNLGGQPGSFVQKYNVQGGGEYFFIVNIQVPGSLAHSITTYYMMDSPIKNVPVLESFIKGDDAYRNSRFKMIPYISNGPWIVKQSVGKNGCLVGQRLETNYFCGRNYIEVDIDVGSSTVARGVLSLVHGYLNNLVIELAFIIQGNTQQELPEILLGTCRLNKLDAS